MLGEDALGTEALGVAIREDEARVRREIEFLRSEIDKYPGGVLGSAAYEHMMRLRAELASLETALAQYGSASATAANTLAVEAETAERAKEGRENAVWYERRFNTSLALASGAAFAGLAHQVSEGKIGGPPVILAALFFMLSLILAGAIPLVLSRANSKTTLPVHSNLAEGLSILSALAFAIGALLLVALVGVLALRPAPVPSNSPPAASQPGLGKPLGPQGVDEKQVPEPQAPGRVPPSEVVQPGGAAHPPQGQQPGDPPRGGNVEDKVGGDGDGRELSRAPDLVKPAVKEAERPSAK